MSPKTPQWRIEVNKVLDDLHEAASKAQEERYFSLFTEDAYFIGTDAKERWNMRAFRMYAHPHFEKGTGWTYTPKSRHLGMVKGALVVWFDELLHNAKYGTARGSGVLVHEEHGWKIAHYVLSFPVPNEKAKAVIAIIQGETPKTPGSK
jgi:hypothetical protein